MDIHEVAFEVSPDALLVVDARGTIQRVNEQAVRQFGYVRETLVGRNIELLVPRRFRDRHEPHRASYLRAPKTRPMGASLDLSALRADGSEFPVDIMLSPMGSAQESSILCVVRDVTNHRKAETMFRDLLEAAPDAMVIVDERGLITLVNSQTERVFGYARVELLGKPVEMLIPARYRDRHVQHRRSYFADPGVRPMGAGLELYGLRRDGSEFPVEISLSPLQTDDGVLVSSAIRDITERKQAEQVLDSLREKEVLLKEIHHRVKNNLAVISSMFYLQSTYTEDEQTIRVLQENQERVRSMALVHESLYRSDNLALIDFGQYADELCQRLFQTYVPSGSRVRLATDLHPVRLSLELAIPCGLILNELVTNAMLHAFPEGGEGEVRISLTETDPHRCTLRVSDTGVGLPEPSPRGETASLGLRLIQLLARQIDGTFEFVPARRGTDALLTFSASSPS